MGTNKTDTIKENARGARKVAWYCYRRMQESKINRDTHYEWMKKDPQYKAAVDSLSDLAIDFAESKLHTLNT